MEMMFLSRNSSLAHAVLLFALICVTAAPSAAQLPRVCIGMVLDGPYERNEQGRSIFEREITELLDGEFNVSFPASKLIMADHTAAGVRAAVDRLLADPEVDFLIALGPLSSNHVGHRSELPKPVIAPFIDNPVLQGIPLKDGTSGKKNLSYVNCQTDPVEEVKRFLEITPFRRLAFLISRALYEELPQGVLARGLQQEGIDVEVLPVVVEASAAAALAAIPEEAEAVYIVPLLQLEPGEFQLLVAGLIERRLPSFSMWGRQEVEMGILAGLGLDFDLTKLARRTALNIQRILLGEEAADLPVAFTRRQRLTINMKTARAIGVYPIWSLMTEAELLHEERADVKRVVSLASAMREALQVNLDLVSAEKTVGAGRERVRRVWAELWPQVTVSGSGAVIDEDRAAFSFGSAGRFNLTGSVGVMQRLYSEPARANYQVEGHLQRSREEERGQFRLDIIQDAAISYLRVLRAKTVERIQKSNLELTRQNLELALSRQSLGVAGPDEVYRWEIQIANNRKTVIETNALRNQAEIALNRILNRPLEEPFQCREEALDDPAFVLSFQKLQPYVDNQESFAVFRNFMVQEAFNLSPELRRLDALIAAQQRALLSARRSYYMPELSAQADLTGNGRYWKSPAFGPGSLPPGLVFPLPGKVDWTVGFSVSLPLFTSGARRSEINRLTEELAGLNTDRDIARQRVEQRIRTALHTAGASHAGIDLANAAAGAAHKNMALISDSYSRGAVDIIKLLDAQNQALQADLSAANAIHDFLIDLMGVQRAVGRFDFFIAPDQEKAFFERLEAFYEKEGFRLRRR